MRRDNILELTNFWIRKRREAELLKIVSWAQFNKIKIDDLTSEQIEIALHANRVTQQDENQNI